MFKVSATKEEVFSQFAAHRAAFGLPPPTEDEIFGEIGKFLKNREGFGKHDDNMSDGDYALMAEMALCHNDTLNRVAAVGRKLSGNKKMTRKEYDALIKEQHTLRAALPPRVRQRLESMSGRIVGLPTENAEKTTRQISEGMCAFFKTYPFIFRVFCEHAGKLTQPLYAEDGMNKTPILRANLRGCRPFIIHPSTSHVYLSTMEEDAPDIDLPFSCCFFEIPGTPLANLLDTSGSPTLGAKNLAPLSFVVGIMIYEVKPRVYEAFAMEVHCHAEKMSAGLCHLSSASPQLASHLQNILSVLRQGRFGEDAGKKFKFKLGVGKDKEYVKSQSPIHVVPKTMSDEDRETVGTIDWSHRWEVRGHWVCFYKEGTNEIDESRIGKDRHGEYKVPGMTWRTDHVKGPEDKPVIRKTRDLDVNDWEPTDMHS